MQLKEQTMAVKSAAPKLIEERLEELKDLVNVTIQSKSHFINNVNHQIRTLSNAIIGFSELLRCDDLSNLQSDYVEEIRGAVEALVSVTNNAFDLSMIETGELNINLTGCPFDEMLDKIDSLMCLKANSKGLKFVIQQRSELPAQICTDSVKLSQCLLNLCNNVIKLTDSGYVYLDISLETYNKKPFVRFDVYGNDTDVYENDQKKMSGLFDQENKLKQW